MWFPLSNVNQGLKSSMCFAFQSPLMATTGHYILKQQEILEERSVAPQCFSITKSWKLHEAKDSSFNTELKLEVIVLCFNVGKFTPKFLVIPCRNYNHMIVIANPHFLPQIIALYLKQNLDSKPMLIVLSQIIAILMLFMTFILNWGPLQWHW